jgi:hypothetical protein
VESLKRAPLDLHTQKWSPQLFLQKKIESPCQGNGKAAESLDALLLVQMNASLWLRSVHQPNETLIPIGIPSTKTKTMHKRLNDGIDQEAAL